MRPCELITLTTDFGSDDPYVGVMKGVIAGISPASRVIDLCHGVPPQDVVAGAFALLTSYRYFPAGTLHVAVVDPGVGTDRAILAVRAGPYYFVAPDNGLLTPLLEQEPLLEAVSVTNPAYRLPAVSRTFHGRDVIAPAAAHLARGIPLARLGTPIQPWCLDWPRPAASDRTIAGQVLYVDRFGNAVTNIPEVLWQEQVAGRPFRLTAGRGAWTALSASYAAAPAGRPLAILASSGYLELAINGGSAARELELGPGTAVQVEIG